MSWPSRSGGRWPASVSSIRDWPPPRSAPASARSRNANAKSWSQARAAPALQRSPRHCFSRKVRCGITCRRRFRSSRSATEPRPLVWRKNRDGCSECQVQSADWSTGQRACEPPVLMRTSILFLLTIVVLIAGAITVVASPQFHATAATRPSPSSLFVIENPPPTPTPTPAPTPTPTPVPTANGVVTFNVPVYKQLRNLDCETAALQMALAALGHSYTQNQLIAMQPRPDTRPPVMSRLSNGQKIVVQWGNPYKNFVGNIDGADLIPT